MSQRNFLVSLLASQNPNVKIFRVVIRARRVYLTTYLVENLRDVDYRNLFAEAIENEKYLFYCIRDRKCPKLGRF